MAATMNGHAWHRPTPPTATEELDGQGACRDDENSGNVDARGAGTSNAATAIGARSNACDGVINGINGGFDGSLKSSYSSGHAAATAALTPASPSVVPTPQAPQALQQAPLLSPLLPQASLYKSVALTSAPASVPATTAAPAPAISAFTGAAAPSRSYSTTSSRSARSSHPRPQSLIHHARNNTHTSYHSLSRSLSQSSSRAHPSAVTSPGHSPGPGQPSYGFFSTSTTRPLIDQIPSSPSSIPHQQNSNNNYNSTTATNSNGGNNSSSHHSYKSTRRSGQYSHSEHYNYVNGNSSNNRQSNHDQNLKHHHISPPYHRPLLDFSEEHNDLPKSNITFNCSASPHRAPLSPSKQGPQSPNRSHSQSQSQGTRVHCRGSSKSHNNYSYPQSPHNNHHQSYRPDMAPSATASHNDPATHVSNEPGQSSSSARQSKSRSVIPTQSGKWILGKTIGAGSMGKVKLARKEDGTEQIACKIIPRGSTDDNHQSRAEKERADQSKEIRTAREAAIVTLLNHPHICGLRDVVRTNYHWYMLFEFVNGGQMLDYIISHGKLKEKQARKFSRQIASALDYCHRNSIVHRDLKIENILISKNGDIKIIDFGLSNLFSPRSHLRTFCGSLYFAAPELLQAKAYTGPEVDIWSFGIVLYVLVCGKVPFDDQSMPALHAKIKKGNVDYPSWISSECKHLMSRMLVTDPKQRASMQEVMNHPWMVKGFNGPPDNYMAPREPIVGPLEPEVISAMQGFNFGSPENIKSRLLDIIESEDYQRAIHMYQRDRESPQPGKETEKRRGFGLDFYKRRNSQNSRDTLTASSSEAIQLGNDPLNAFNPLLSIYYLVKEKQERDRTDNMAPSASTSREKEKEREREKERDRERDRDRDKEREREKERERRDKHAERHAERHSEKQLDPMPILSPPKAAHTNSAAYELPGEKPTGGRTRPRARTHGEDDAPEAITAGPAGPAAAPDHRHDPPPPKKEGTAAGLLRRFSTRKKREPEREVRDRSHPPIVQVSSPSEGATLSPRKSFSIRGRRGRDIDGERSDLPLRGGSSQPQQRELLSPPASAGGINESRRSGLGRSTSVNSGDVRRHKSARAPKEPPPTSGSDQSVLPDRQASTQRLGPGHGRSVSLRAKSLGHARRESIQRRRAHRQAAQDANVPEETDMEQDQSGVSTDRLDNAELAKPVFLKGLFSVSTTSGKSVPAIRADIRRVLRQLNVDFTEIRGGFACRHVPSIDLNKVQDPPMSPHTPSHRRRFSFGHLRRTDDDQEGLSRLPTTPRTPRQPDHSRNDRDRDRSDRDRSFSNSETSVDSIPRTRNGTSGGRRLAPGETSTQVQSDLGGSMVLEFEIFIVKVPLLSLHGIQFKRVVGNTWQYKSMADQILKELRL